MHIHSQQAGIRFSAGASGLLRRWIVRAIHVGLWGIGKGWTTRRLVSAAMIAAGIWLAPSLARAQSGGGGTPREDSTPPAGSPAGTPAQTVPKEDGSPKSGAGG